MPSTIASGIRICPSRLSRLFRTDQAGSLVQGQVQGSSTALRVRACVHRVTGPAMATSIGRRPFPGGSMRLVRAASWKVSKSTAGAILLRASRLVPAASRGVARSCRQKMFTSRHDLRVWDSHLDQAFPQLDTRLSVARRRAEMYADLEPLRLLRNRIAHHEPIFTRNLTDDLAKIM